MDKKIVLFDMDGTLCKYDDKLLHLAHKRLGLPLYRANDLLHFHTELVFEEQYREQVGALADEEGFFKDLEPYPGAIEAFHAITNHPGITSFICTTPKRFYKNHASASEKHVWVAKYLGKEYTDKIILTRDKTLVQGHVLLDDKPEIEGAAIPVWKHVYHDRPYNRGKSGPRIISWSSWEEVLLPLLGLT